MKEFFVESGTQDVVDETRFQREKFTYEKFISVNGGIAAFKPKNGGAWVRFNYEQLKRLAQMPGLNQDQVKEALESPYWT